MDQFVINSMPNYAKILAPLCDNCKLSYFVIMVAPLCNKLLYFVILASDAWKDLATL